MGIVEYAEARSGVLLQEALWISVFAIIGVQVRLWTGQLFEIMQVTSDNTALFHDLPANALGCFLMGFLTARSTILKRLHPSLHVGGSTGFLGSLTTFASWNLSVANLFIQGQVASAFIALIIGAEIAIVFWIIGTQLARWFEFLFPEEKEIPAPQFLSHHLLLAGIAVVSLLLTVTAIAVWQDESRNRDTIWIATLFAPVGALGRWRLAVLNSRGDWFFWGTFAANMMAICVDIVIESMIVVTDSQNLTLLAIPSGVAGCLSTVSTFVNEIQSLQTDYTEVEEFVEELEQPQRRQMPPYLVGVRRQYVYTLVSLAAAQVLFLSTYGAVSWARG